MKEQAEIYKLFERANELWFGLECKLNEAYSLYQEILKQNPSDPVILYQLANVFWAFEEFDRAKKLVSLVEKNKEDLSEYGKELLEQEKPRLLETTSFRTPLPLPPSELSLKNLDEMKIPPYDWIPISGAAEERRIFYLAICAMDRAINDGESARERMKWYDKNEECLYDLQLMKEQEEIYKLFERANELWFGHECRLNEAYSLYQEILKQNPSDPVILYQLANVFWAFEEFDRAKKLISLAIENKEDLSEYGKKILVQEKPRLLETTSFLRSLSLPPNKLSLKNLQDLKISDSKWVFISGAAEERRMFYLAICAMCSAVNDAESPRETIEWYDKNDECFDDLERMRREVNQ